MLWTQASWNVTAAPDGTLTDEAGASVTPETFIRVFMTIREADANTVVQPQAFEPPPTPAGFTVGEWGGAQQRNIL